MTASAGKGLLATLDLAERLVGDGYRAVPHLAARMISGCQELEEITMTTQPQQTQPEQQPGHHRSEAGHKTTPETAIDDPDQNRVLKPNPSADRG